MDDGDPFAGYFLERPYQPPELTRRELEVLTYLSRGLEYEQVGTALFISLQTVKTHARHARYKLRAKNTTHACSEALRRGLIR